MTRKERKAVPVNIISGPLGVGKTTLIKRLLEQRPEGERWAVLVNEFGLVGLDASMMQDSAQQQVEIREVAGGCICCTAGFLFDMYLVLLLQQRPDRLLIEPTGLAEVTGILETLRRPGIAEAVDLRAALCLLDIRDDSQQRENATIQNQIEAADVVLGTRAELVSPSDAKAFEAWVQALEPAKLHVGLLDDDTPLFDLLDSVSKSSPESSESNPVSAASSGHLGPRTAVPTDTEEKIPCTQDEPIVSFAHRTSVASAQGWRCLSSLVFREDALMTWLSALVNAEECLRVKAVVHTDAGWMFYNLTPTSQEVGATSSREESRLEVLFDPKKRSPMEERADETLRGLVVADA